MKNHFKTILFISLFCSSVVTFTAKATYVGGYYIENYDGCNANNLSHTDDDTWGFINNIPASFQKNFVYANQNVWPNDWKKPTDYYSASNTPSGHDGADANFISYISTHGGTNNKVYTLVCGKNQSGSCRAYSSQMKLGNNVLRYLFLSTCQSLKMGNGIDAYASGENPYDTWVDAINGVRCIYGYSSNSIDSPDYGSKFWKNWNTDGVKTKNAFLDASWDIYTGQVPVVMCFGPDSDTAEDRLNETHFRSGSASHSYGQWTWYNASSKKLDTSRKIRSLLSEGSLPLMIEFVTGKNKINEDLLINIFPNAKLAGLKSVYKNKTSLHQELIHISNNKFKYNNQKADSVNIEIMFEDEEVERIANDFINKHNVLKNDSEYFIDMTRNHLTANSDDRKPRVIKKTVIFKQKIASRYLLGAEGEIRVTVNGKKEIVSVESDVKKSEEIKNISYVTKKQLINSLNSFKENLAKVTSKKWPDSERSIKNIDLGYLNGGKSAQLTYRAIVEVSKGGFSKLHKIDIPFENL